MTRTRMPMTPEHERYLKRYRNRTAALSRKPRAAAHAPAVSASSFSMVYEPAPMDLPKWDRHGHAIITTMDRIRNPRQKVTDVQTRIRQRVASLARWNGLLFGALTKHRSKAAKAKP
jgi:hypothetical protein